MQQLLRHPEGVISTRTGFMGGENDNPTEENNGGHAEVVEVIFDPERLSYRGLLEVFFQVHRADLDEGVVCSLYRSEIFYTSPKQRTVAEEMIRDIDASGHWPGKTVTRISEASVFWEMGPQGQDYFIGITCMTGRRPDARSMNRPGSPEAIPPQRRRSVPIAYENRLVLPDALGNSWSRS
jgi:peptide-methionine (S)-S-oxide reductase